MITDKGTSRARRTLRLAAAVTIVAGAGLASCGAAPDHVDAAGSGIASTAVAPPSGPLTGTIHVTAPHTDRCDPLGDGCLLPFPSDFYTVADATAATGRRVRLDAESLPANASGVHVDPTHWNDLDGFSPAAAVLFQVPGLDLAATGAAPVTDPAASVTAAAPVVLLDATTRRRLPYWVELDAAAEPGTVPTAYIRPAVVLPEGHRIVVGLRQLRRADRSLIAPSDVFRAYRDRRRTDDARVEARRPAMERVFTDLAQARVARRDLVLAWDFTVASAEALAGRLLHLRDDAFARLGTAAPTFTVTADVATTRTGIAREITGTYQVPRYLSGTGAPGSQFVLGPDGLPTYTGTYTAPFRCIIPTSATATRPAAAGIYGHGLLGTAGQIGAAAAVSAQGNRIFCGTDLIGMAQEDIGNVIQIVQDVSRFNTLADRLQQGHLNTLFLGRLMIHAGGFGSHPSFQDRGRSLLTRDLAYYGLSQGGIMGGATTAVAQDWTRAVLGVPAMNYGLLLDRSVDFDSFRLVLNPSYPSAADRAIGLQLLQMLWDRGEPSGYVQHLTQNPYPRTPEHQVLLQVAFGDHQVANVATEVEARSIGARVVTPVLAPGRAPDRQPYWGVTPLTTFPFRGSAVVMFDSGAPAPPVANVPPRDGNDPHSDPRADPGAIRQIVAFVDTGLVTDVCGGAPCRAAPR